MVILQRKSAVLFLSTVLSVCLATGCVSYHFRGVEHFGPLLTLPVDCGVPPWANVPEGDSSEEHRSGHPACKASFAEIAPFSGKEHLGPWGGDAFEGVLDKKGYRYEMGYWLELLMKFREPVISEVAEKSDVEIYRFYWRRIPDKDIVVRIEKSSAGVFAVFKKMNSDGVGYRVGVTEVSDLYWRDIQSFTRHDFWSRPWTDEGGPLENKSSFWLLEGVKGGKYHVIGATNPCVCCNAAGIVRTAKTMLYVTGLGGEELY